MRHCYAAPSVELPICVAVRYLILRTGCEKHGRKNPLPFLFSKRSPVSGLRQIRKQGKGRSSKRKGNRRCPFLFAPAAGAALSRAPQSATPRCISAKNSPPVRVYRLRGSSTPLSRCRKRCRPSGTNTLTQFVCPSQPVQKKVPPVRANTPAAVRAPCSAGAEFTNRNFQHFRR